MEYLGVGKGEFRAEYEVNRSLFIATVTRIEDVDEGFSFLQSIRRRYPDATHNPYAAVGSPASGAFRFSDDGEPQGTSGAPILNALKKQSLYHTAVVVTRYFGGIKLGAGGLVQAYSHAAVLGLEASEIVRYRLSESYSLSLDYKELGAVEQLLRASEAVISDTRYADSVEIDFSVPTEKAKEFFTSFQALSAGKLDRLKTYERKYITYKR